MKHLSRPIQKVADILDILISDAPQNNSFFSDIDSIINTLTERETLYIEKVDNNTLFEITRDQNISPRVNKDDMIRYYDYRILQKPNGRIYYDGLILSAPHNICPYCTIRAVKTVDHFLPKSKYPSYSITPVNLVPCCRDCNTNKKISYPTNSIDQTFHPYFDNLDTECWIKAELRQTDPLSFQYFVIRPNNWDENKKERANFHFDSYSINELFSNEANRELRGMQNCFKKLYSQNINLLRLHIEETYISCLDGHGLNDWKTLMYKELSTNEWFLTGCDENSFFN